MPQPPRATVIHDLDDPRVEDYRELRERNLWERDCFIAESDLILRVLVARGRFPIRSVLVADKRVGPLEQVLAQLPAGVAVYTASQQLLNQIAGFHIHRGVLASADRLPVPGAEELLSGLAGEGGHRLVVLEGLKNHDNVGGIFRNAAAFGASAVLYDKDSCDPLYRKAIRVSMGGALFVPFARATSSAELLAALKQHGFRSVALSPQPQARALNALTEGELGGRVALWLGSEGPGLSDAVLEAADFTARIPIEAGFDSLNVATTSGIALHTLRTLQGLL